MLTWSTCSNDLPQMLCSLPLLFKNSSSRNPHSCSSCCRCSLLQVQLLDVRLEATPLVLHGLELTRPHCPSTESSSRPGLKRASKAFEGPFVLALEGFEAFKGFERGFKAFEGFLPFGAPQAASWNRLLPGLCCLCAEAVLLKRCFFVWLRQKIFSLDLMLLPPPFTRVHAASIDACWRGGGSLFGHATSAVL